LGVLPDEVEHRLAEIDAECCYGHGYLLVEPSLQRKGSHQRRGRTIPLKSAHAAERDRPDILKRREAWFENQLELDPGKLVFIDETGAATNMARLRGRAQKGERLRAGIPQGHWKTTTFVAGLRLTGMTAPMVLDGQMNGTAFLAYVQQVLVPGTQARRHRHHGQPIRSAFG